MQYNEIEIRLSCETSDLTLINLIKQKAQSAGWRTGAAMKRMEKVMPISSLKIQSKIKQINIFRS
jgi:hypothetical protein